MNGFIIDNPDPKPKSYFKSEIRISKLETNPKLQFLNDPNARSVFYLKFGILVIRYCLGFRASDFEFLFDDGAFPPSFHTP